MALLSAGCGGTAQKSPSGNIRAEVFAGKEGLYYTVTHDGRTVIDTSAMGVTIDGTELFRDAALRPAGMRKIDETYSVTGRKAVSEGRCNEYLFDVTHRPSGYKYRLQTRLYDDGFAYRFVLPGDGTRTVNGEAAQWRPPQQSRVWFAERNSGWKLLTYAGEWISTTADSLHIVSRQGPVQTMPLLYRTPDEYVMIAEAALYDYSGMRLRAEPGASLRADFTEQEGFELSGDIVTPWRVTIIARDLDALVNTDIITSLNPAPDPELFADTSWIVPGRSLWSWWSGIDGGFMREAGIQVNELTSGCICCSLVGDFADALQKVLAQFHPDRILIEPSGVGKLSDVIRAVQGVQSDELVLNGFTTVVDANKCRMYMKNFGEFFNNQVENASAIILSRTEGIRPEKLDAAVALLREKNPTATIVTTPWTELDGKQILQTMERRDTLSAELAHLQAEAAEDEHEHHHHDHDDDDHACCCGHHHDHDEDDDDEHEHEHHHDHDDHDHDHCCDHDHDHHDHDHDHCCGHDHDHHHHHADEVFTSWGTETPRKYTDDEIRTALDALINEHRYGIVLRAKGIVPATDGGWIHFDYVPGESDVRRGSAQVTGRVCVIGSKLNEQAVKELFGIE